VRVLRATQTGSPGFQGNRSRDEAARSSTLACEAQRPVEVCGRSAQPHASGSDHAVSLFSLLLSRIGARNSHVEFQKIVY
jgi:hypothetical protein